MVQTEFYEHSQFMHHHFLVTSKFKPVLCCEVLCILPLRAETPSRKAEDVGEVEVGVGRGCLDSHANCLLRVIMSLSLERHLQQNTYCIMHVLIQKVLQCFISLCLQAKSPNELKWLHNCSCPFHSCPILHSFIQPSPSVALIQVGFFKEKHQSTHFLCVCLFLLCAYNLSLWDAWNLSEPVCTELCETL